MTSVITTIRRGVNASKAVKVPVKAATTANITLSAEQTIDGISCVDGDRVLVKDQTDGSENGIYAVDSSTWNREPDWDGTHDVVKGTYVYVSQGSTNNNFWQVSTADPITIGTTSVSLISTDPDSLLRTNLADTSTGEGASLVGVEDSASNFAGSTVEAVLAEIVSDLASSSSGDGASRIKFENGYDLQQTFSKGADLTTSDVTANILTVGSDGNYFDFTGTDTINGIATVGIGTTIKIHFDAAATLTHNSADLVLPGGANITTAAGDEATFFEYATADWRCLNYQVAAGVPPEITSGSWSPAIWDGSNSNGEGQTYSYQVGRWTKIGDRVIINGGFFLTSLGTLNTGQQARVGDLPFTSSSSSNLRGSVCIGVATNLSITAGHSITGAIDSSDNHIGLELWDATSGTSILLLSELTASGAIAFEGSYTV